MECSGMQTFLKGLGADGITSDTELLFQTDAAPFEANGVPVFLLWNDMDKYSLIHHNASDTFDSVSQSALSQVTAVIAVTAFGAADMRKTLPPHLNSEQVEAVFGSAGQLAPLQYFKTHGLLP
jgi:hypothetical protein